MNEAQTHQAFNKWLNKEKLPFLHSRTDRKTSQTLGDPDYCVCLAGRCLFLELKVGKNKLSPVQETRIAYLRRAGNRVEVVYGLEPAIEAVRAWAGIVDESKRYLAHDWTGLKQTVAAVGQDDGHVPVAGKVCECQLLKTRPCPIHGTIKCGAPFVIAKMGAKDYVLARDQNNGYRQVREASATDCLNFPRYAA